MNETPVYKNLERCREIMAIKSTSDFAKVRGGNNDISAIAEGALKHAKANAPDNIDKLMYEYLMDLYVGLLNPKDRQRFLNRCYRYAEKLIHNRGMRKKRAGQILEIALYCLLKKNISSTERAKMMGISKSTYCEHYRDCIDDLLGVFYNNLAIADALTFEGMQESI